MFDLLQTRTIYPFYDHVLNTTNDQRYVKATDTKENHLTDSIYVVNYIPPFLQPHCNGQQTGLEAIRFKEFEGFMANLDGYDNINGYLMDTMGSKSRTKVRGYVRKLETCFDIRYELYFGSISKSTYNYLFEKFHGFINKRFQQRGDTHELLANWEYIKRSSYDMILNKTASLFVIYNDEVPIDICLNYHYQNIFHNGIRSYDIAYSKFRLGYIDIFKQLEWCLANNVGIFDLSSGDMQYKRMWCNIIYDFEHQILYDKKSIRKKLIAQYLVYYYKAKENLKKKNVHLLYHKIRKLGSRETTLENKPNEPQIVPLVLDQDPDMKKISLLDLRNDSDAFLRELMYNFQYQYSEKSQDIKMYKANEHANLYYIIGKHKIQKLGMI